eukprot:scaffold8348_cov19-Prasinocladus_malaysianus.AAC.2
MLAPGDSGGWAPDKEGNQNGAALTFLSAEDVTISRVKVHDRPEYHRTELNSVCGMPLVVTDYRDMEETLIQPQRTSQPVKQNCHQLCSDYL